MGLESVSASETSSGPPFALGYHQFILIVAIQDEGEGGGTLAGSVIPRMSGLKKTMVRKGVFLTRKETRARLWKWEGERIPESL